MNILGFPLWPLDGSDSFHPPTHNTFLSHIILCLSILSGCPFTVRNSERAKKPKTNLNFRRKWITGVGWVLPSYMKMFNSSINSLIHRKPILQTSCLTCSCLDFTLCTVLPPSCPAFFLSLWPTLCPVSHLSNMQHLSCLTPIHYLFPTFEEPHSS